MNFVHLLKLTISSILQSLHIYKLISLIWILFRQRELKCVGKENFLLVHQKLDKTNRKNTIHKIEWFNRALAIACCCFLETFNEFYSILISTLNIRSTLNRISLWLPQTFERKKLEVMRCFLQSKACRSSNTIRSNQMNNCKFVYRLLLSLGVVYVYE